MKFNTRIVLLAVLGMLALASADHYSDLFSKYGCGALPSSGGCDVTYNIALQSQWSSNGVQFYQYGITLTATSGSDFPVEQVNISVNLGSASIQSTYGLSNPVSLSSSATQYTIQFDHYSGNELQAGQSWSGSGLIVQGAASLSMSVVSETCDSLFFAEYRAALCAQPTTIAVQQPGNSRCAASYTAQVQSVFQYSNYAFGANFQLMITNTGSCPITDLEIQLSDANELYLSQKWNLNMTTFLGASGSSATYAYDVLNLAPLAPGASFSGAGFQYEFDGYSQIVNPRPYSLACAC